MDKSTLLENYYNKERPIKNGLLALRAILLNTVLKEDFSNEKPIYIYNGINVAGIDAHNDHYGIFFYQNDASHDKSDPLTTSQQENSEKILHLKYIAGEEPDRKIIENYIQENISKYANDPQTPSKTMQSLKMPTELENALSLSAHLKKHFALLPKEKQDEYLRYISEGEDQSIRNKRVEHCIPFIMRLRGIDKDYL